MTRQEFLKQQYTTLREEIRETKNRIFKTMGFGLIVVPSSHFLAQAYKLDILILSLPILVIVVALLYLSENNSLMRCGRYIRYYIEPNIRNVQGWEHWLEKKSDWDARSVDKYLSYAFYLLFFVYFSGSAFVAGRFALSTYGVIEAAVLLASYVAVGLWFLIYLIYSIRTSTSSKTDPDPTVSIRRKKRT